MEKIEKGIVFSNDIKRILRGINAFDYRYEYVPCDGVIDFVREDFKRSVGEIFSDVVIISESEMMDVNNLISGDYPHCFA